MERRAGRVIAGTASAGLALIVAGRVQAPCSNDAGNGDVPEVEACLTNLSIDPTNDGCNQIPPQFSELGLTAFAGDGIVVVCANASNYNTNDTCDMNADCVDGNCQGDPAPGDGNPQGTCVGPGEPSVNRRDTDWYRISAEALAAADADGNGVVQITSHVVAEFNAVTFFISVGNPLCNTVTVLNAIGCGGPQGSQDAVETVVISDHPNGIVAFVSPGMCSGAGIFDGYECDDVPALNDYNLAIMFSEPPTACADPAVNPNLLPCFLPNTVPGCNNPDCCILVCMNLPLCCVTAWSQPCADMAGGLGCAPSPLPLCIATGPDSAADGYLLVCPDPFGGWADLSFGGQGDQYNPAGAPGAQPFSFSNAFFLYRPAALQREPLANWPGIKPLITDPSLSKEILQGAFPSDTNDDGVIDRVTSAFRVTGDGLDLMFDLTQAIDLDPPPALPVAAVTQTYTIHNNLDAPIDFVLLRQVDFDLVWAGGFSNDSVGTGTNGSPLERFVFQGEVGQPATHITMSSPQGAQYVGAKATVDPDGAGPGPPMGAGTDLNEWEAYGVPEGWGNFIAYVGYNTDGSSGAVPGDAHVDLEVPVSIAASGSAVVNFTITCGAMTPLGLGACPWDCAIPPDGEVDVLDFLAILGQWGRAGTWCDIDSGGVSIIDFLSMLGHWGTCPP